MHNSIELNRIMEEKTYLENQHKQLIEKHGQLQNRYVSDFTPIFLYYSAETLTYYRMNCKEKKKICNFDWAKWIKQLSKRMKPAEQISLCVPKLNISKKTCM